MFVPTGSAALAAACINGGKGEHRMEINGWFVMALGMITVFIGLLALQYLTRLMSVCCMWFLNMRKRKES